MAACLTAATPTAQTPHTMEEARKALEGRWVLVSLNVSAADGRSVTVDATGVQLFESFGALSIDYRMSDEGVKTLAGLGIKTPNAVVSTSGRVVIDTQQRRITHVGDDFERRMAEFDRDLDARRKNPFALERTRHYTVEADGILRLATRYEDGKEALVSRWKKGT